MESTSASPNEAAALRAALDESRQKLAELAAELESLRQRPVQVGPTQEEFERLQADHDEAVRRAIAAEDAAAQTTEALDIARKEAAGRPPVDAAAVPDRIRALELELEMTRAMAPAGEPAALSDPRYTEDPLTHAFTPQEEELATRVRELEATVAELEAERSHLEQRLASAGLETPSGSSDSVDDAGPAGPDAEQ
jgi:DNA repair exonuclease SbcCD ATPase subunit